MTGNLSKMPNPLWKSAGLKPTTPLPFVKRKRFADERTKTFFLKAKTYYSLFLVMQIKLTLYNTTNFQ